MTYKVVKGIPMPPSKVRSNLYPFYDMDIGDSFFVPMVDVASRDALRQSCYYATRKSGNVLKFRIVTEDKGFRVFRVF